ncbi:DUF342 domain-containing protein [Clostridium chromiireducens]|uniref:DUF342 domain-containing protein n=1 Tax=Clostridium chromiireducens TaxID=225345 RepID=A0A399ITC8_9CLOT|nr:FapA family protein [Clostridium chromiireducens]RII36220.1 DUF342 domain-containing protein [Clostridium chromiireducens]
MSLKFSATSVDECLEKASLELNIPKEDLKYKVTKEEKRFFKRKIEIEVLESNENKIEPNEKEVVNNLKDSEVEKEVFGAKVENGKIIITEPKNKDDIITIKTSPGIILLINGQKCDQITPVTVEDKIEYKFEEIEPVRSVDISITNDRMEAYINIKTTPKHIYELADQEYHKNLILVKRKIEDKYPPQYTPKELKELLKSKGVVYGIIEEEIEVICGQHNAENVLIAKGLSVQNDIPDEIELLFKESHKLNYDESVGKVDYRNTFLIANVKSGDIIAQIVPGKSGNDGKDILGMVIAKKTAKKLTLKIGEGCKLENDKVIATAEGKPDFKGNTFTVNKLYKVDQVDLKSGNIDFVGNVEIVGVVSEAMEVRAGNELYVGKNVESAILRASGQITILGNVLNSTVTAGSENVERRLYLNYLQNVKSIINDLTSSTEQVKDNNLLGQRHDGEIIKILIENKFKSLPDIARHILSYNMSRGIQHSEVTTFIINKLLGLGPLKIKDYKELVEFDEILKEEIDEIETLIVIPTDVYVGYTQGSTIEASGSVFITGKGQYTSEITALNNIEFLSDNAVCRGGVLAAGSEIKLKTVGSTAGVNTMLKVSKKGRIKADIAYNNTIFCFGEKQVMLEVSSKNVEAYVDKTGEIVIDKFIL